MGNVPEAENALLSLHLSPEYMPIDDPVMVLAVGKQQLCCSIRVSMYRFTTCCSVIRLELTRFTVVPRVAHHTLTRIHVTALHTRALILTRGTGAHVEICTCDIE